MQTSPSKLDAIVDEVRNIAYLNAEMLRRLDEMPKADRERMPVDREDLAIESGIASILLAALINIRQTM
jgi:hypothetical protein